MPSASTSPAASASRWLAAITAGEGDVSRVLQFKAPSSAAADASAFWPVIAATTLAFFAMVGFEESVKPGGSKALSA